MGAVVALSGLMTLGEQGRAGRISFQGMQCWSIVCLTVLCTMVQLVRSPFCLFSLLELLGKWRPPR